MIFVEACINQLFDNPAYPKAQPNKGKRKQEDLDNGEDGDAGAGGPAAADGGDGARKQDVKGKKPKIDWNLAGPRSRYAGFRLFRTRRG